ncbi:imidazole glycerol phosphate synthase subunit HisH [Sediminicurvatus halobius]|uniref:Imidazole glycerol phosphate synthase subunit HisH n=1 Tax=Sediminicurvatus halobius TaxID=2182432 RepID=A0A2U2MZ21_9GAMM|nr:imidazole glycerol phosphate synthase subunit HisH [Spiribacter halobius]PWG62241.1 imidazole glycerol phosphate synthase subunit HisH [Spiribacter halobius]UEX78152.1 imidazole glycerol phosphate synthase subunit HisH [Spiribacter halobius]
MSVAVIDYGMGNLRSVAKALEHVGARQVRITDDADAIAGAERVVFPGQGAVRDCMSALQRHELVDVIRAAITARPFLGVCMGMQALMTRSEENEGVAALDVFPGEVRHFRRLTGGDPTLKIPHMGWNGVRQVRSHPLWAGVADGERFYFVHSYFVAPEEDALTLGTSDYGAPFAAVIGRGNVFATQFHPEKSQQAGLRLLANFLAWDGTD